MSGHKEGRYLARETNEGKLVRIPVGIVSGARSGGQITILGGQHGTEYDGIEAVQKLYREINPDDVRGTIVIGLTVNEEAFVCWNQFAPTPPEILDMMRELATGSHFIVNCHGGEFSEGMCPYVICRLSGNENRDAKAMEMAEAFGLPYISLSKYRGEPQPSPTGERPAWWLWPKKSLGDELGIPEITPEVGERGSRDDAGVMYGGILNVLRQLDFLEGKPRPAKQKPKIIGDRYWLTAEADGIFFPEVRVCQDVGKGELLGTVRDFFGAALQEVRAPAAGKIINMNWGMPVKRSGFLLWLGVV
jgi:predicted deacylase